MTPNTKAQKLFLEKFIKLNSNFIEQHSLMQFWSVNTINVVDFVSVIFLWSGFKVANCTYAGATDFRFRAKNVRSKGIVNWF